MQKLIGARATDRSLSFFASIVFTAALLLTAVPRSYAALIPYLGNRSDKISDSTVSSVATHAISFSYLQTTTLVGSIRVQFCSNSPIPEESCTAPSGFDASARILSSQAGQITGFSIHPNSDANNIILTRPPVFPTPGTSAYIFDTIQNPNIVGSYYVRLLTYGSSDATGTPIEEGGAVFAILPGLSINAEVPPYLRFCAAVTITNFDCSTATSYFIDMGEFVTSQTTKASSQFLAATNAEFGYSITISGTTLTSGNNTIPPLASPTSPAPGTSQFGLNLRSNTNPAIGTDPVGPGTANAVPAYNVPNLYKFQNGETIVTVPTSNDNRKFTASYIINISGAQTAGIYATTISYMCLANF
jgi:hypothetical protein